MADIDRFLHARDLLLAQRSDLDAAAAGFEWPQLEHFNWALDHFDRMALNNDQPALWIVEESGEQNKISFAQMSARSSQVANWLRGLGVARGERVLLMLNNEVALWESMLACIKLGAVLIPSSSLLTPSDLADRLQRGDVRHVIVGAANVAKFATLAGTYTRVCVGAPSDGWSDFAESHAAELTFSPDAPTRADDPLLLYFTSGTTSKAKLVLHTHQSYPVGHLSTMYWIGLMPGDVHLNISSPGWAKHAWSCFFAPWNAGACVFIYNYARFDAKAMLAVLEQFKVSTLCAAPTVWRMLIQADLAAYAGRLSLREVIGAGEPLNPEVIEQIRAAWGLRLRDGFGQTETTALVGNSPGQVLKAGSMGRPLPGYQVVLVDADGVAADEGEIALQLQPRPLGLMVGYQGDDEKNAEVMRDGLYRTGDVATRDAEGFITYVGRADDVFKSAGYRISPFELESVAIEHDAIAEAAVVPSPDAVRGTVPKIFIVLAAGHTATPQLADRIFTFLRAKLAPYKRVRRLQFAELPKTISGKIRRVDLRAQEIKLRAGGGRAGDEHFEEDFKDANAGA